jgi:hypothetical protein
MFAPIDVPDRSICLAMTDSLRSRKYLYKRTIRNAKALDFVNITDSVIARFLPFLVKNE